MHTIGDDLADQFERMWMMLREAINHCPDEEWKQGRGHWFLTPCCLAFHVIDCVDYHGRESPEGYDPFHRFGTAWRTREAEKLPDRAPMLDYLEEIRDTLGGKLRSMSDEALLADEPFVRGQRDEAFPRTGPTVLAHMIYTLRHSMFHLGQIQSELRRRGLGGARWH